ncbi:hypothetical protein EJB05_40411, partial [Eragrostis curvula]
MASDESMHIVLVPFPAQGHFAAFLSLAGHLHRARPSAAITLVSTPGNVAALRASASRLAMASDESMHIVLSPFPAQGHFAAFLSLAGHLHRARPSADMTLVSTPGNVAALRASASASSLPFLRFHTLPFVPEEHGLPAGAESLDALPVRHFLALFHATESPSLRSAFDEFVLDTTDGALARAVVVVIADPFLAWTSGVARSRGARHAIFVSCGAFGSAVYHSLWNHLPHLHAPAGDAFLLPDHTEVTVHRSQLFTPLLVADGADPWSAFHRGQIAHACDTDALLINTTEEFEPTGLRMLRRTMGGTPVCPVGPLVRVPTQESAGRDRDGVVQWLDAREARSVLYISFGSQNSLLPEQMMELAAALELAGRPFVWAIRPPLGSDDDDNDGTSRADRWLPEGFEERVRGNDQGLLVWGWAPQLSILAHASTAAFLSHCGWNSVLESVTHGVPVIGWPLAGEQFFNAKMLDEEWGVCVEVARGNVDAVGSSVVDRARIVEAVEKVMGDSTEATEMRRRTKEVQDLVLRAQSVGGSSMEALEEFFTSMLRGISANNS